MECLVSIVYCVSGDGGVAGEGRVIEMISLGKY